MSADKHAQCAPILEDLLLKVTIFPFLIKLSLITPPTVLCPHHPPPPTKLLLLNAPITHSSPHPTDAVPVLILPNLCCVALLKTPYPRSPQYQILLFSLTFDYSFVSLAGSSSCSQLLTLLVPRTPVFSRLSFPCCTYSWKVGAIHPTTSTTICMLMTSKYLTSAQSSFLRIRPAEPLPAGYHLDDPRAPYPSFSSTVGSLSR